MILLDSALDGVGEHVDGVRHPIGVDLHTDQIDLAQPFDALFDFVGRGIGFISLDPAHFYWPIISIYHLNSIVPLIPKLLNALGGTVNENNVIAVPVEDFAHQTRAKLSSAN